MKGIDTPYSIVNHASQIKAAGYSFVVRYLSPNTANFPHKQITEAEVAELSDAGLWIGGVWEKMGSLAEMNAATGQQHAEAAVAAAARVGQPAGSGIYFAVDFDAMPGQMDDVLAYFKTAHAVVTSHRFLTGCYGSGLVCESVLGAGFAHYAWLAGATGWQGSREFNRWSIEQGGTSTVAGLPVDLDTLSAGASRNPASAGFWKNA